MRRNMPLSEAQALSEQTSLQTNPQATPTDSPAPPYLVAHDPQADRLVLEKLAQWCEQFSPVVALPHDVPARGPAGEPCHPECLYLDVTHLGPLFGGEQNLAQQVVRAFAERGYHARLALADTLGAAWAVSHFDLRRPTTHPVNQHPVAHEGSPNWQCRVVPVGKTFSAVQALPVAALRLPPGTVATLQQLGISQIGQLAQLPRSSLSSRFGDELLRQFDLLLGRSREVLVPYRPPPVFHADWQLDYPTTKRTALEWILEQLVQRVSRQLAARGEGVVELVCRLRCTAASDGKPPHRRRRIPQRGIPQHGVPQRRAQEDNGTPLTGPLSLRIGLFQPTSCPEHLLELLGMQLDQLDLPGPVESLRMEATLVAPLERRQTELFSDGIRQATRQLACLVNRLSSRLGYRAVTRPRLVADVQPERSYFDQPLTGQHRAPTRRRRSPDSAPATTPPIRPLYLRPSPLPVEVVAVAPDGPPARLYFQQCHHHVTRHWGPERIETAWWRGRSVRRDYYRIETTTGNRFWLFRQLSDGQWFLQGAFG